MTRSSAAAWQSAPRTWGRADRAAAPPRCAAWARTSHPPHRRPRRKKWPSRGEELGRGGLGWEVGCLEVVWYDLLGLFVWDGHIV